MLSTIAIIALCRQLVAAQPMSLGSCLFHQMDDVAPVGISASVAVEACRAFCVKCRTKPPGVEPSVRLTKPRRANLPPQYDLDFPGHSRFFVDATTGAVDVFFDHSAPLDEVSKPSDWRLRNLITARTYFHRLATDLGVPTEWRMRFVDLPVEVEKGAAPLPEKVTTAFEPTFGGYRMRDHFAGKIEIVVRCPDSRVLVYSRFPVGTYKLESRESKLTLRQARSLAAPIVRKFAVGVPKDAVIGAQTIPTKKHAELMYVRPNGSMGAPRYDPNERPFRVRLAWVLYYAQDEEVWIDAGDGKLLGGIQHDPGPKPKRQ
jgi:hypothetical protein